MASPVQKNRLGRGLASLIGEPQADARVPAEGEQRLVAIGAVRSGGLNPRKTFRDDELEELASSIRTKGLVQPILVRPDRSGAASYEIVAGERRWRAAQRAGVHQIAVIVRELSDREVLELALIENVQRADLNAIEEAAGYRDLIDRFSYSQEQLSDIIGKSRSHIANIVRLLKLPARVQELVQQGKLSAGHARALVGRRDAEALAHRIVTADLNVRQVEALVQGDGHDTGSESRAPEKDADTRAFEKELSDALGLKVEIKRGSGESGTLLVRYGNFEQLDYIRERMIGSAD